MKKGILIVVGLVVLALAGYTLWFDKAGAPQVAYTSIEGKTASTDSLKGKVVLVNFWATSCPGCIQEMPELKKTHERYAPQGYETVAVAMSYDPPNYVHAYVSDKQLPFFVVLDSQGSIAKAFGDVQLTPTSILIGKDGNVIKRFVGVPDFTELNGLIEKAIKA
ncbi:TlpA family protein disulfide reductase [Crenobacter cavernae]|uniref:TlpA family protein disulfide reductase n=1 Tax=Crenobacter cavernae TaxID=2290923 RepID=A0A345Y3W9_9NEIS|nr:TlpA disulfide reductase family protein [Crenobacter cavernae]AXK38621.1 TlpA family protein disulfide reductase [Crenobacter cavernae]